MSACQNAALSCAGNGPSLCFSSDAHVNINYFYTILKATAADIAFLMATTRLFIYLLLPSSLQHVRSVVAGLIHLHCRGNLIPGMFWMCE